MTLNTAPVRESNRQIDMRAILNPQPEPPLGATKRPSDQLPLPSTFMPLRVPPHSADVSQRSASGPVTFGYSRTESTSLPPFKEAMLGARQPQNGTVDDTIKQELVLRSQHQNLPSPSTSMSAMVQRNCSSDTLYTSEPRASCSQGTTSPVSSIYGLSVGSARSSYSQPHLPLTRKGSSRQLLVFGSDGSGLSDLDTLSRIPYTIDVNSGSAKAAEKRRKNSYASKRFRQRKKAGEAEQLCIFRQQEDKLRQLTRERDFYRAERNALRDLVYKAGVTVPPRPVSPRGRSLECAMSSSRSQSEDTIPATQGKSQGLRLSEVVMAEPRDQASEIGENLHNHLPAGPLHPQPAIGPSDHLPFRPFFESGPGTAVGSSLPHIRDFKFPPP
ncbi:hypothetical protein KEM56_001913 [Ascosphaera pollenicola]|nr:hypothetical protein KEM56_001913 [Ascosphaera pollenicola]